MRISGSLIFSSTLFWTSEAPRRQPGQVGESNKSSRTLPLSWLNLSRSPVMSFEYCSSCSSCVLAENCLLVVSVEKLLRHRKWGVWTRGVRDSKVIRRVGGEYGLL